MVVIVTKDFKIRRYQKRIGSHIQEAARHILQKEVYLAKMHLDCAEIAKTLLDFARIAKCRYKGGD